MAFWRCADDACAATCSSRRRDRADPPDTATRRLLAAPVVRLGGHHHARARRPEDVQRPPQLAAEVPVEGRIADVRPVPFVDPVDGLPAPDDQQHHVGLVVADPLGPPAGQVSHSGFCVRVSPVDRYGPPRTMPHPMVVKSMNLNPGVGGRYRIIVHAIESPNTGDCARPRSQRGASPRPRPAPRGARRRRACRGRPDGDRNPG